MDNYYLCTKLLTKLRNISKWMPRDWYLLPLHPIIEIVPFSRNNSCRWMQYGLSFVALLEIYAVEGEKAGT